MVPRVRNPVAAPRRAGLRLAAGPFHPEFRRRSWPVWAATLPAQVQLWRFNGDITFYLD